MKYTFTFIIILVMVAAIIYLYVIEIPIFQNTVSAGSLVKTALMIGGCIGLVLAGITAPMGKDSVGKIRIGAVAILSCLIVAPLLASLLNRHLTADDYFQQTVQLVEQKAFFADRAITKESLKNPDGYWTFIMIDDQVHRLKSDTKIFDGKSEGDLVTIQILEGKFGYKVVQVE